MKTWIVCLLFLFAIDIVHAQAPVDSWKQKYSTYYASLAGHKMHVVFNHHRFATGDTAFFSIHLFENDLRRVKPKRILDFHVIDSEGKSVYHFLFSVLNGQAHNQWVVPDLTPGVYRVAIHHYGLKSFIPEVIYQQPIQIIKEGILQHSQKTARITVEGGHLIRDVQNRLVIGTAPNALVKLIDQSGKIVASEFSRADGFCQIKFQPAFPQRYFITTDADTSRVWLPKVEADGIGLRVIHEKDFQKQKVHLMAPSGSKFQNERMTLLISQRDQILDVVDFLLANDSTEINLQSSNWPDGLIHLSVLRSSGELLAYRNFYHQKPIAANIFTLRNEYLPRERVDVKLDLKDSEGKYMAGVFSMSVQLLIDKSAVSQYALFDPTFDVDFANEDFAWSDLIEIPPATIDNHVVTRSKPQPWNRILAGIQPLKDFRFKSNMQRIGKAYRDSTRKPLPNGTQVLFYLQKAHHRYQFAVNDGVIVMPMQDYFGTDELLTMAETPVYMGTETVGQVVPEITIDWVNDEIKWPSSYKVRESTQPDPYAIYTSQNKLIRKSFSAFLAADQSTAGDDGSSAFPAADIMIRLADYEPFADMEELIREIIPSLQHRKTRKGPIVLVALPEPLKVTGDPTYIIDGIASKNTAHFMSLKPAEVSSISIVNHPKKLIPLGLFGKNGLVIVKTKKGNLRQSGQPPLVIEGLSKPHLPLLFNPTVTSRAPHFNAFVTWNPIAKIESEGVANVSFYTTDDIGTYRITVKGISQSGIPFTMVKDIDVNLQAAKK